MKFIIALVALTLFALWLIFMLAYFIKRKREDISCHFIELFNDVGLISCVYLIFVWLVLYIMELFK